MARGPILPVAGLALLCLPATAQLIAAHSPHTNLTDKLWYVDVVTDERVPLTTASHSAVAVDDAAGVVWLAFMDELRRWTYGSPNPPVVVGSVRTAAGVPVPILGLASVGGRLFATTSPLGSTIHEIDPVSLVATPVTTTPAIGAYGALAFHAADGMFYAADFVGSTSFLYRLDLLGGGAATQLTLPSVGPAGMDLDGLAAHAGLLYLVPDDTTPIRIVDLASGQLVGELTSPFPTAGFLGGAEWASGLVPPPGPRFYCQPKATTAFLSGFLTYDGDASASAGQGFLLIATQLAPNLSVASQVVWFAYSVQGPASVPFSGGTLCLAPPIARLAGPAQGGASRIDFNTFIASGGDPALVAGAQVWAQAFSRSSTGELFMTQGLTTVIAP